MSIQITPDEVLKAIVKHSGNMAFALDTIKRNHKNDEGVETIEESLLVEILNSDSSYVDSLYKQLRLKFTLEVFQSLSLTNNVFVENLNEIEPKDIARALSVVGTLFTTVSQVKEEDTSGNTFADLAMKVVDGLLDKPKDEIPQIINGG